MQNSRLHAKLLWKTGSEIEAALHLVKRAWSVLTKAVGLRNSETAFSLYIICDERTALLHIVLSRSGDLAPVSERTPLDGGTQCRQKPR